MKYIHTWKNTKKQIYILRKSIHIGWVEHYQYITQHRISSPSETSSPATSQSRSSSLQSYVGGPKINNTKKSSISTKTEAEVQVHLLGQKHSTHGYWKTTQYIEIYKAKSFFTQNTFVHNIISNSAAPIDTQITKTFLQPNLYEIVPIIIKPKNLYEIKSTMKLMLRIHGPKDWISLGSSERMTSFFSLKPRVCMNSAFQSSAAACKQKKGENVGLVTHI